MGDGNIPSGGNKMGNVLVGFTGSYVLVLD
jgi:hypothetical protein